MIIEETTTTTMKEHREYIDALRTANSLANYKFEPVMSLDGWYCRFWNVFNECPKTGIPLDEHRTHVPRNSADEARKDAGASVRKMIRAEMEQPRLAYENI